MFPAFKSSRAARHALLATALGAIASPALADRPEASASSRLTISAEIRLFAETMDGQFRPAPAPESDTLVSFRTLIAADYDFGGVHVGGELDDSRGYAQKRASTVTTGEINALEPLQAYIAFDLGKALIAGGQSALTLGRFTMDIGAGRLVARPDFSNSPVSFLGARFDWRSKAGDRIIAFWTRPFDRLPDDAAGLRDNRVELDRVLDDRQFFGVSGTKAGLLPGTSGEFYGYRLVEHDAPGQPTRDRRLLTFGGRLLRAPAPRIADFELEAALQYGHTHETAAATDLRDLDVHAALFHAEGGWTFPMAWSPRIAMLFDYASGDRPGDGRYGRFDLLYGARRIDYGPTSLFGPLGRANLISAGITIEGKPAAGWDFFVKGREVWLDQASDTFASTGVRDRAGHSGRHAGAQVEWRVRTWLVPKRLRIEGGGAYLAKGRFLKVAPNAPAQGDTRYAFLGLSAIL
jgi:hypothetical protein